ncbi:MAG: alpha/beta fold hydrolase [Myxococcota bacterium]
MVQANPAIQTKKNQRLEIAEGLTAAADFYGDPGARPALLLHGGGQTRHSWSGTAERLAEAGWYAVTVDARGHGQSDWAQDGNYHTTGFRDDLIEIASRFEIPPVLIGASMGGISSLLAIHEWKQRPSSGSEQHSQQRPELASALVLVDIATRMESKGAVRIMDFMRGGMEGFESLEAVADSVAAYNPHRPRPKDISGLEKNLRRGEDGRYHWHWDPAFMSSDPGASDEFVNESTLDAAAAALEVPTLLVRGKMSDLLSEDGARAFLDQVPHAEFADVSGAGHMVAGDRNDLFSEAVLRFLEKEDA